MVLPLYQTIGDTGCNGKESKNNIIDEIITIPKEYQERFGRKA